ncbi:MAG: ATP-binding protein [Alphaproteobacteria bacterium]|nr:ATP-binding protein [Alphaproteobacteria bacterium]
MREVLVISGKGGTGKTSLTASFALLAENAVVADCDVDAADLHLILTPTVKEEHVFKSGHEAFILEDICTDCGACLNLCRFDAIRGTFKNGRIAYRVDPLMCEGCGTCARFCPKAAVELKERVCGKWMISETRAGPMVHARLGIAAENSGKLVATVRQEAKKIAEREKRDLILVDGPPGIGCPVIASISGASDVIVVTEPTLSGAHDLARVLGLAKHFSTPAFVCVNKMDLSVDGTEKIIDLAKTAGATFLGGVRYDKAFTNAQKQQKAIVETDAACAEDVRKIWNRFLSSQPEKEQTS